jgi:hypothetical protein
MTLTGSHAARRTRLRLAPEETYGALPATPEWQTVPLALEQPGPHAVLEIDRPERPLTTAVRHSSAGMAYVQGRFASPGMPDATELLLDLALGRDTGGELPSFTADAWSPDDPRRLGGLVVSALRLAASPSGSLVTATLLGRSEAANEGLSAADFASPGPDLSPFALRNAQVTAAGTELAGVRSFVLYVDNAVQPGPRDASVSPARPAWMRPGARKLALTLRYYATTGTLRDLQRSVGPFALAVTLPNASGRTISLDFPAVYCRSVRRVPGREGPAEYEAALEPVADATGNDVTWTVNA